MTNLTKKSQFFAGVFAVLFLTFGLSAFAQQITVSGTVKDRSGDEIMGANILEKGTQNGATTDINGRFTFRVERGKTLVVSYIGYVSQELPATAEMNIVLEEDSKLLDEVIVVGYGTQQKVNLTGSVAQISGSELESRPIQNVSTALQGLMAGVASMAGEGRPGQDGATIRVRGVGTLNTGYASPYVLVDGIETGELNSIDPNDIESVSVLKDAASAAIYGSKAANGVILITTKRGKGADKPVITYRGYYGFQKPTQMIERLSSYDYARLLNQALAEDGDKPARFSDDDLKKFQDGSDPYGHPNTDWYALAYRTGAQHQHNVNVNGGSGRAKYMASAGFLNEEGILPNSDRRQFNGRINLDMNLTSRLDVRMNMGFIKNDYRDATSSYAGGSSDQIIRQLNIIAPWITARYADGTYGTVSDGNPIAWLDLDETVDRNNQKFTGLLAADVKLFDGLKATLQGSYVSNVQHYKYFMKDIQYNPNKYHGPNSLDERYYLDDRTNFDALLNYDKHFGVHGLKVLLGWHTEKFNYIENIATRKSFPNNELTDMNSGSEASQTNSGYTRQLAMLSGFGRINYDYAGKYLFEANLRADASSSNRKNRAV